jgi:uncharacterized cupin superfamily protein
MASAFKKKVLDPRKRKRARLHEIFKVQDVPRIQWSAGDKFGGVYRKLGEFGRSKRIGVHLEEITRGRWNSTFHWHTHEEEHFYILEGRALFRVGNKTQTVGAGSYIVFPPDGRAAHAMKNIGPGPLRFLVIGTRETGDVCVYPDSKKVAVGPLGKVGRLTKTDYWDGEV